MKACIDHMWLRREKCRSNENWIPAFAGMTDSGWTHAHFPFCRNGGMSAAYRNNSGANSARYFLHSV